MKHRSIGKIFLLTIVTLGIYRLYWFIKTRKEMMRTDPSIKILSPAFFLIPLTIVIATVVIFIASLSQAYGKMDRCLGENKGYTGTSYQQASSTSDCSRDRGPAVWQTILLYFSFLAIWPLVAVWLWSYSKGVEKITNEKTSFAIALIVLLLVPDGIDILIIQDAFNKVATPTNPTGLQSPAPAA